MDRSSLMGVLLGLCIVTAALLLGGVPIKTLLNTEAILVVFGGTFSALLTHFSFEDIRRAFRFSLSPNTDLPLKETDLVDYMTDAASFIRAQGVIAVQSVLDEIDIPFLQSGFQMVIDNISPEQIQHQLGTEMEMSYRDELKYARVLDAAGGVAPTMGIIGAVVGLIQIMTKFHSPNEMGLGVASAFIATLYGVGVANLILLPLAGKMKEIAKHHWVLKSMMLEGILCIRDGQHPVIIREKLEAYIGQREKAIQLQQRAQIDSLNHSGVPHQKDTQLVGV
jgi:chemotaxis protein MotA